MTAETGFYWEEVYRSKHPTKVSWYQPHLEVSIELIEGAIPRRDARIIDAGAGESTLADDLLAHGYRNVYALDVSPTALKIARQRLGASADRVTWLCGDVLTFPFERHQFDLWHDRAVFHFLTDPADRARYVRQVANAIKPGGHVIVASFGPEGPLQCSGLDVERYDPSALHAEFGPTFRLLEHRMEQHRTPSGSMQQFVYCLCSVDDAGSRPAGRDKAS